MEANSLDDGRSLVRTSIDRSSEVSSGCPLGYGTGKARNVRHQLECGLCSAVVFDACRAPLCGCIYCYNCATQLSDCLLCGQDIPQPPQRDASIQSQANSLLDAHAQASPQLIIQIAALHEQKSNYTAASSRFLYASNLNNTSNPSNIQLHPYMIRAIALSKHASIEYSNLHSISTSQLDTFFHESQQLLSKCLLLSTSRKSAQDVYSARSVLYNRWANCLWNPGNSEIHIEDNFIVYLQLSKIDAQLAYWMCIDDDALLVKIIRAGMNVATGFFYTKRYSDAMHEYTCVESLCHVVIKKNERSELTDVTCMQEVSWILENVSDKMEEIKKTEKHERV